MAVHSWNMAEQRWDKIGDVVGAAGGSEATSGKKLYKGKDKYVVRKMAKEWVDVEVV